MAFFVFLFIATIPLVSTRASIGDSIQPSEEDMFWVLKTPQEEYKLPQLPFAFNAMEPYIDASTMEIHHSAIFKDYTEKLNKMLKKWRLSGDKSAPIANLSLVNMWRRGEELPVEIRKEFYYYGGGYVNHVLYFSTMTPNSKGIEQPASKELTELIDYSFTNFTGLKKDFEQVTEGLFGSGWAYLARARHGHGEFLTVMSTLEEVVPLYDKNINPILALDLWEHAYFKKYGNKKKEYVNNWWKTVDWVKVERLLNMWRILEPNVDVHTDL